MGTLDNDAIYDAIRTNQSQYFTNLANQYNTGTTGSLGYNSTYSSFFNDPVIPQFRPQLQSVPAPSCYMLPNYTSVDPSQIYNFSRQNQFMSQRPDMKGNMAEGGSGSTCQLLPKRALTPPAKTAYIGVFWDIENCTVPRGKSALHLVQKIRETFFHPNYIEAEFVTVCDTRRESPQIIQELNDAQVTVIHVSGTSKNAADDKLRQSMRRFADAFSPVGRSANYIQTHGTPAILLISGDVNFSADLYDLRYRKRLHIILLHNRQALTPLLLCAHEHHIYGAGLDDLPLRPSTSTLHNVTHWDEVENVQNVNDSATAYSEPGKYFDILVTGIPENVRKERVEQRLSRLTANCAGKVVRIFEQYAIIRFKTHIAAVRAAKRIQGEDVSGAIIQTTVLHPHHYTSEAQQQPPPHPSLFAPPRVQLDLPSIYNNSSITSAPPPIPAPRRVASNPQCNPPQYQQQQDQTLSSRSRSTRVTDRPTPRPFMDLTAEPQPRSSSNTVPLQTEWNMWTCPAVVEDIRATVQQSSHRLRQPKPFSRRFKSPRKIKVKPEPRDDQQLRSSDSGFSTSSKTDQNKIEQHTTSDLSRVVEGASGSGTLTIQSTKDDSGCTADSEGSAEEPTKTECLKPLGGELPKVEIKQEITSDPEPEPEKESFIQPKQEPNLPNVDEPLNRLTVPNKPNSLLYIVTDFEEFSHRVKRILSLGNGTLEFDNFFESHKIIFGDWTEVGFDGPGVALEHLITAVEGVDLAFENGKKLVKVKEIEQLNSDEVITGLEYSWVQLRLEIVKLLKTLPRCAIELSQLQNAYERQYGKSLTRNDLGERSLDDLLNHLRSTATIHFMGEVPDNIWVTLTHEEQMKRLAVDILRILKTRRMKILPLEDFASVYASVIGQIFEAGNYGMCSLRDLLKELSRRTGYIILQVQNNGEIGLSLA